MTQEEKDRVQAETFKLMAESAALYQSALKSETERRWYPAVAMAVALGAGAALAKLFL